MKEKLTQVLEAILLLNENVSEDEIIKLGVESKFVSLAKIFHKDLKFLLS